MALETLRQLVANWLEQADETYVEVCGGQDEALLGAETTRTAGMPDTANIIGMQLPHPNSLMQRQDSEAPQEEQ